MIFEFDSMRVWGIGFAALILISLLLGWWIGSRGRRRQSVLRMQALEWLREERETNVALATEIQDLTVSVRDRDQWRSLYHARLEVEAELRTNLGQLESDLSSASSKLDASAQTMSEQTALIVEKDREHAVLRQDVAALQSELAALKRELKSLTDHLDDKSAAFKEQEGVIWAQREQLAERAAELSEAKAIRDGLEDRLADLTDSLAQNEDRFDELRDELGRRETEIAQADKELDILRAQTDAQETELATEAETIEALRAELGRREADIAELSKEVRLSGERISDLEARLTSQETVLSSSREQESELRQALARRETELAEARKDCAALQKQVEMAEEVMAELRGEIANSLETISGLQDGNTEIARRLEAQDKSSKKALDGLDKNLAKIQKGFKTLDTSIKSEVRTRIEEIGESANTVRDFAISEAHAAAKSQYEALLAQQELQLQSTARRLNEQTSAVLASPQLLDYMASFETETDVPDALRARLVSARVMKSMGRMGEAIPVLEECRSENSHSRTISLDLAAAYLEVGRREDAVETVKKLNISVKEPAAIQARQREILRRATPGVLLCALPKSAGVFIYNALAHGLDKPLMHAGAGGYFPNMALPQNVPSLINDSGTIYHTHAAPSPGNLIEVSERLDRMILHLRDPRGALLSWAHFIGRVVRDVDPIQRLHYGMPAGIEGWKFGKQIDWYIGHVLPSFVSWSSGWLEAIEENEMGERALVTTYEELVKDQDGFFDRLLSFYAIDEDLFEYPARPEKGTLNFRKGDPQEWNKVFTAAQRKRASKAVPNELKERFGWLD